MLSTLFLAVYDVPFTYSTLYVANVRGLYAALQGKCRVQVTVGGKVTL
jgi:hypothetical protein